MRRSDSTTAPPIASGVAPPTMPVLPPCGTIATRALGAARTIATTSSSIAGDSSAAARAVIAAAPVRQPRLELVRIAREAVGPSRAASASSRAGVGAASMAASLAQPRDPAYFTEYALRGHEPMATMRASKAWRETAMSHIYLGAVAFGVTLLVASLFWQAARTPGTATTARLRSAGRRSRRSRFWVFFFAFGGGAGSRSRSSAARDVESAIGAGGVGWLSGALAVAVVRTLTKRSVSSASRRERARRHDRHADAAGRARASRAKCASRSKAAPKIT